MAKPKNCISVSEARELHTNWTNTRAREIQRLEGFTDTCDFTFSVAELEEYIAYVKELSANQRIDNPGIRIFFAAYNSEENDKATIFLAPTMGTQRDAENNYDIDPLNRNQGGWPPNVY